jgi:hypothetical protein
MDTLKLLAMLCLMNLTSTIALAANEEITLGPAMISMDLGRIGFHTVEKGDIISMDHKKVDFRYEIIPANIKIEGTWTN